MRFAEHYIQPPNSISLEAFVDLVNNGQDPALPNTAGHKYDTSFDNGHAPAIDPEKAVSGDIVDVRALAARSTCKRLPDGVVLRGTFALQETNGVVWACAAVVRTANMNTPDPEHYVTTVARLPVAYNWGRYSELLQASTARGILQVTADVRLMHDQHEDDPRQTTQVAEIATIYAAEQPFDGDDSAVPVGGSVVTEGKVASIASTDSEQTAEPTLAIATSYGVEEVDTKGLGRRHLRQLDPRYVPHPDAPLLHPAKPVPGDTVQVRLYKTTAGELKVDPGNFLKSTDIKTGVVPAIYVTEANENRHIESIIRAHKVASEIRRILKARGPGMYQRLIGDFLLNHTGPEGEMDLAPSEKAAFNAAVAPAVREGWHPAGANLADHRLAASILETTGINVYTLTASRLERLATSYMRGADLPANNAGPALLDILRVTKRTAPDTYDKLVVSALEEHGPATLRSIKETGQISEVDDAVLQFALQGGGAGAQTNHNQAPAFLSIAENIAGALPGDSRRTYGLLSTIGNTVYAYIHALTSSSSAESSKNLLDQGLTDKVLAITGRLRKSINNRSAAVWSMSEAPDKVTQFEADHTPDPQDLITKIEAIEALVAQASGRR